MLRSFFCSIFLALALTGYGQAQQPLVTVSGRVLDAGTQTPLGSISIIVRPSRMGTTTRPDGSFGLKARPGDTLTFSSVGFKNATYFVTKSDPQSNLKILLQEAPVQLQEVQVDTRLSAEKVNRVLRNMKRPPEPDPVKAPPAPEPLFEEKETVPVKATILNPATFMYDKFSKEGVQRQKMEEIRREKNDSIRWRKEQEYDNLFLDRNLPFKHYIVPYPYRR